MLKQGPLTTWKTGVMNVVEVLAKICPADASARRRAEYSSDASNYRVPPTVVVFPKNAADVVAIREVAAETSTPITARGAGTSVAGNAIGTGIVIDYSRHMNRILEIDPKRQLARVQPGVVLSDLQQAARPHGLWFGPDPSTKNRATLGGMIGNNACGPHALAYGRTADNTQSLHVVDGLGREFCAEAGSQIPGLSNLVTQNLALIRKELGRFTRQVSGYSLEHLLPENGKNLARALVGTEGTCVNVLEATVNLVPLPTDPVLVVLGYIDMIGAANAVPHLLNLGLLAIEGMDARLVGVVRQHRGRVPDLPNGAGWLLCEAPSLDDAKKLVSAAQALDARVVTDPGEAAALWQIRADGVGLAGRTPAGNPAWPGWEDAAVPPEALGAYLQDFEDLMGEYGLQGIPYGHFGDGCMHVRIDWPLSNPMQVPAFKEFIEKSARLVAAHGGSNSGEHGDGRARSSLLSHMYSAEALDLFGQFKAIFDPNGLMNPGVLVDPQDMQADLRRPNAVTVEARGFAFSEDGGDLTKAVHRCVGVGKCRADNAPTSVFMCPSYQASKDEKDVTRGRARVLQEATQSHPVQGWDPDAIKQSLDLCLSCKACGRDCPAGVDMSRYKSEVTYQRYRGKLRPRTHYVLGWLPRWARVATAVPFVAKALNTALSWPLVRTPVFKVVGMDTRRKMTAFASKRFSRWFKEPKGNTGRDVIVWADSFSEYLDPSSAKALVRVLEAAGYRVRIPSSQACCGLTWITTGQLDGAKKRLRNLLDILGPAAQKGVPIVGIEPSCTAVLRDDLPELLPDDPRATLVSQNVYTLAELLSDPEIGPGAHWGPDLSGVNVLAQPHCHQHAVMGFQKDRALLERLGAQVNELAGCCGLAGNFGMEKGHYETSVAVANNSLLPALEQMPDNGVFLADGYSCRTQAQQLAAVQGVSLAQLLEAKPLDVA